MVLTRYLKGNVVRRCPAWKESRDKQTLEVSSSKQGSCRHWLSSAVFSCLRCHLQISATRCGGVCVSVCPCVCLSLHVEHLRQGADPAHWPRWPGHASALSLSAPSVCDPAPEGKRDRGEMMDSRRNPAHQGFKAIAHSAPASLVRTSGFWCQLVLLEAVKVLAVWNEHRGHPTQW